MKRIALISALALPLLLAGCGGQSQEASHEEHGEHGHEHEAEEAPKGEHGGRLLEQDGYGVELAIAEAGTPPKFRAWLYRDDKPLSATAGRVEVKLQRLGNVAENHVLDPQRDGSLLASTVVGEPHSFDVELVATIEGKALNWKYESYEGRTTIDAKIAENAGIKVAPAAAGTIADEHIVQGLLTPIENRIANVTARYPGPIRRLAVNVGDAVRVGQVLASVESNLSLTTYDITAPISGVVLARNAALGNIASESA